MNQPYTHPDKVTMVDTKRSIMPEPVAWVDLLKEAEEIVKSKPTWKRFIDGTPLSNDIAVWMADFASGLYSHADVSCLYEQLERVCRERDALKAINVSLSAKCVEFDWKLTAANERIKELEADRDQWKMDTEILKDKWHGQQQHIKELERQSTPGYWRTCHEIANASLSAVRNELAATQAKLSQMAAINEKLREALEYFYKTVRTNNCVCLTEMVVSAEELLALPNETSAALNEVRAKVLEDAYHAARTAFVSVDGVCLMATQMMSLYSQITAPIRHMAEQIKREGK